MIKEIVCELIAALGIAGFAGCEVKAPQPLNESKYFADETVCFHNFPGGDKCWVIRDEEKNIAALNCVYVTGFGGNDPKCIYLPGKRKFCGNFSETYFEMSPETLDSLNQALVPYQRLHFSIDNDMHKEPKKNSEVMTK